MVSSKKLLLPPAVRRFGSCRRGIASLGLLIVALLVGLARPGAARAQTDEIQVYDASIAPRGKFNLTVHDNFTPDGATVPVFAGALISNHSLNGTAEWAYGAKDWLELGFYMPLYSISSHRGATINGGKLRLLFVTPHAEERTFFYGMNFEFSYNSLHWDSHHYTSEIRPIIGWHLHPWDIIFNPILDNSWRGGFAALDFAPATRIAYNLNDRWAVAGEEYSDIGPLRQFLPTTQQWQQAWAVVDHHGKLLDVEAGIGFGLNAASDKVTMKLMFSRDLN